MDEISRRFVREAENTAKDTVTTLSNEKDKKKEHFLAELDHMLKADTRRLEEVYETYKEVSYQCNSADGVVCALMLHDHALLAAESAEAARSNV